MKIPSVFLILIAGLIAVSCGGDSSDTTQSAAAGTSSTTTTLAPTTTVDPAGSFTESDLVYVTRLEDGATATLDIHLPAESRGAPLVIGADESLVAEGVIVVTFDDDDHLGGTDSIEELLGDRSAVRTITEQYACAVRLARVRAAALGNEDPVVVLNGLSFVGGVAAHVALFGDAFEARWDEFVGSGGPPRQYECEAPEGSAHVDVFIGMAGAYDIFVPIVDGLYGLAYQQENDPKLQEFLASAVGANPDLMIRLIHGTNDDIPVEFVAEFAEELGDAGHDVQLITFPGGHEAPPTELYVSTLMDVLDR